MDEYPAAPGSFEGAKLLNVRLPALVACQRMNLDGRNNETDAMECNSTSPLTGFVFG
jgi:hypothetical protein